MKNAILLHGKPGKEEYYDPSFPSASNYHWLPWLQKQLIVHDIKADTPEVPKAYDPQYPLWQKEFERFEVTNETILVGHSCGAGFLVRWLSEHKEAKPAKVVLVAPWLDPDRDSTTDFFDFEIDPNLASRVGELVIFNSDDDESDIQESVRQIREAVEGVKYREFQGLGHFTHKDMQTSEFPELLEECLK